jgi:hypothetical protein
MPSKKYPSTAGETTAREPLVKEAKAQPYGREKEHGQAIHAAASVATVKRRLRQPVKRTRRDIAWALDIVGIGEGPVDLSDHARGYLYGHK